MSHWNYRVVRKKHSDGTTFLSIHEVYFDDQNRAWAVTRDPDAAQVEESEGETPDNLKKILGWMLEACNKPVIDYDSIPEPGAHGL